MKILINVMLYSLLFLLFSCKNDDTLEPVIPPQPEPIVKESISGYVQKGPFASGTSINIAELDSTLSQSGRNFNTQITNDNGNFTLNNVVLNNNIVEIKADGFYFNEVRGINSENRLVLYSLSDLTDKNTINVNVLSYLEKPRIEYLVQNGKSFSEAKKQAQKEVLAIFEVEKENIVNSEELDISKSGEDNAVLLASSVILQGRRSVAELSELLSKISLDIREDGILNDSINGSHLINHAKHLNLKEIRNNIETKYFSMNAKDDTISDFESVVTNFVEKTGFNYTLKIEYPKTGKHGINLLALENNEEITSPASYSLKALLPEGFNLRVRIKRLNEIGSSNWFYTVFPDSGSPYEMTFQQHNPNGISIMEFTTKKDVTDADHIIYFEGKGSGAVEVYENGAETPTRITNFTWGIPKDLGIIYPQTGKYGENLLLKEDNSVLETGKAYSLALTTPNNLNLDLSFWLTKKSGSGSVIYDKYSVINWSPSSSEYGLSASLSTPGTQGDIQITFLGTGECTLELSKSGSADDRTIIFKHFKW